MHCRPADVTADFPHIAALWREYKAFLHAIDCYDCGGEQLESELASLEDTYGSEHGALFLAFEAGKEAPSGTIAVKHVDPQTMELRRLYVRPSARSQGMGRALLECGIAEARRRGSHKILLDTFRNEHGPLAFYKSLGFHECPPYNDLPASKLRFMEKLL